MGLRNGFVQGQIFGCPGGYPRLQAIHSSGQGTLAYSCLQEAYDGRCLRCLFPENRPDIAQEV